MGGLQIGPLLFSAERAPFVASFAILIVASWIFSRQNRKTLLDWSTGASGAALVAARVGFVWMHRDTFSESPLSAFAIWEGGFQWGWGVAGFALATMWHMQRMLAVPMAVILMLSGAGWYATYTLTLGSDVPMPVDLELTALDGTIVRVGDWQGQPVVVNLWASWCPPCQREMPMMADVASSLDGVSMHFVNQGEGQDTIHRYLMSTGVAIHPLMDANQQMMQHYGAMGLPATLFLSADGALISAHMGEISRAQILQEINKLKHLP